LSSGGKANNLFSTSVVNAIAPTAAQIAAGQSTRVVVSGGTDMATPVGAIYESNNAGSAGETMVGSSFFVNATWTQIPTDNGSVTHIPFVQTSVMAYGGRSGGVDNADVLYAASGPNIFLRSTAGGTLTATAGQPGGGNIVAIALDPNDWHTAFVTDGSAVYMTTNSGTSWTPITGNLNVFPGGSTFANPGLTVIDGSGNTTVLFAFSNGVQRMLTSNPGVWSTYGAGLPNAVVGGLVYNAADNVLVDANLGRGAWEIPNASTSVFSTGVLQINGDTDFAGEDDTIKLVIDANNNSLLDAFLNGAESTFQLSTIQQINVNGLGGNDTLIMDDSNGLINVPLGTRYDGGTGFDQLQEVQTGGGTRTGDTYSVGPLDGSGTSTIVGTTGRTQQVFFQNLSPVLDTVPAALLTVNATPADNAINYTAGTVTTRGMVTIDNQESIEFGNKTSLAVNALAGTDTIGINDGTTPTGLTGITINGGDPSAGDTLIVTGVGAAVNVNTAFSTITGATGTGGEV